MNMLALCHVKDIRNRTVMWVGFHCKTAKLQRHCSLQNVEIIIINYSVVTSVALRCWFPSPEAVLRFAVQSPQNER